MSDQGKFDLHVRLFVLPLTKVTCHPNHTDSHARTVSHTRGSPLRMAVSDCPST